MNLSQQLINGLILGSAYACVALGWTVLLGAARLVNFAHGQLYMMGAFACWYLMSRLGLPYWVAAVGASLGVALLGIVMFALMRRLVAEHDLTRIMVVTLGMGYVIEGAASLIFSGNPETLASPARSVRIELAGGRFTLQDIVIVSITLLLYGATWLVQQRTRIGAVIRAVAEDPKLAQLRGINVRLIYIFIFLFECGAVSLAATLVAPRAPILTSMGFEEIIMTFVVVIVGGVGSIGGALLAGLGLGIFVTLFSAYVSAAFATAAAFSLLLAFLVVRPGGIAAAAR